MMTIKEAIECLENEKDNHINTCKGVRYETRTEAVDMGIKALAIIDKLEGDFFKQHDMVCVGDLLMMMDGSIEFFGKCAKECEDIGEHYKKLGEYYNGGE